MLVEYELCIILAAIVGAASGTRLAGAAPWAGSITALAGYVTMIVFGSIVVSAL